MTSETLNLHVSKNLNISKMKQDNGKLKTTLRLVWKCCCVAFKIGSKIFPLQWHLLEITLQNSWIVSSKYTPQFEGWKSERKQQCVYAFKR